MNRANRVWQLHVWLGLFLFLLVVAASLQADAQLAGIYRSAPGTLATYTYHADGFQSVLLPADITVTFSGAGSNSMLAATIHQPIIGDTQGEFDYGIVDEFPMEVTGASSDGQHFHGDLLGTQYLFDWDIEPASNVELLWNGQVYWAGGRYESTTITDARLIAIVPGDYNRNGVVNGADYVVWRDTLGQTGAPGHSADGNNNGQIDAGDYDFWRQHFSETAGGGSSASGGAAVPEPVTALLMLIGQVLAISFGRRAKRR